MWDKNSDTILTTVQKIAERYPKFYWTLSQKFVKWRGGGDRQK